MNLSGEYEDGHEERGTGFSIGTGEEITSPDTFKRSFIEGEYSYGSFTSDGMLTFRASRLSRDYDRTDDEYLYRDRVQNKIGAEFDYQIAPATNIVIDISEKYVRYDVQESEADNRDSNVIRILGASSGRALLLLRVLQNLVTQSVNSSRRVETPLPVPIGKWV